MEVPPWQGIQQHIAHRVRSLGHRAGKLINQMIVRLVQDLWKAAWLLVRLLLRIGIFLAINALYLSLPLACLAIWRPLQSTQELMFGLLLGLIGEAAITALLVANSAKFMSILHQININYATKSIIKSVFFIDYWPQMYEAKEGDLASGPRGDLKARTGEAGVLLVHEGNLVLLEQGKAFTRLVGPGHYRLYPFERPVMVLDLRPQSRRRKTSIWTRDGLPVQTTLYLSCRMIWKPDDPENEARLIRMAYQLDNSYREKGYKINWAGALADEAQSILARRLSNLHFDELWSPYLTSEPEAVRQDVRILGEPPLSEDPTSSKVKQSAESSVTSPEEESFVSTSRIPERPPHQAPTPAYWQSIREEIQKELEKRIRERDWDVEIIHFAFEPPVPWPVVEPMIRESWLEQWRTPWRTWAVQLRSRAFREQLRQRELARAIGQRELLEAIAAVVRQERPLEDPRRGLQRLLLRLVELIRHWAHPDAALLTPTDMLKLLYSLQRMARNPPSEGEDDAHGLPPSILSGPDPG